MSDPTIDDLRETSEWLRVTLSSIGDAVITTDAHGHVTFLNPVAQALTGWTQEAAIGRPLEKVFSIVNQETRATVENPALRALREGVIVGLANHTVLIARDGTERPIDDSAAPIMNAKGEVAGSVLVFRDISERYRQEKLIADTLAYAVNILETLRDPFLVLDSELRVVSANREFYVQFHASKEETEGRLLYDLGSGQWNIPKLRELLERIVPENHSFDDFEVTHHFDTIGEKVMMLNARRVRKPGNHSELILLAIQNITQRVAAELALKDSEMRYRRLFQTAKDGILILDANTGKIIDANAFMSALVGLEPGELLGRELYEIGMYADQSENKAAFRELQETKYLRHDHLPVRHRNGHKVEVEFIANVYHEDHRMVAQCNVRDISKRVAMEVKIQEQTEALADASRRKDEFLAMLSHELRNPLNPIRSAVNLLKVNDRGSETLIQRQAREIIERQVGNLAKIVSDLLEVSRFASGRIRLDLQPEDLNRVVAHALETVDPLIRQRKHTLTIHPCVGPIWVNCDVTRLEEVFVNVLSNAVKYTEEGGFIEIWCEQSPGHDFAQVRVRDNGMGIDSETLPRIFDLFSQADRSLARSGGGLGIGLSLAHRLVELQGGSIEAKSPPEGQTEGSEFIVRLPLTSVPELEEPEVVVPKSDGPAQSRLRVLVVDDSVDSVFLINKFLQGMGHSVQTAYTGPDALKLAQEWRPDVVLLDIGLPGLDGYEVARRLRRIPELNETRIIAVTGYGQDTDIALAREAGFDAHLLKPVEIADIEKAIGKWYTR